MLERAVSEGRWGVARMTPRIHYDEHGWHVLDAEGRVLATYASEDEAQEALALIEKQSPPQGSGYGGSLMLKNAGYLMTAMMLLCAALYAHEPPQQWVSVLAAINGAMGWFCYGRSLAQLQS